MSRARRRRRYWARRRARAAAWSRAAWERLESAFAERDAELERLRCRASISPWLEEQMRLLGLLQAARAEPERAER